MLLFYDMIWSWWSRDLRLDFGAYYKADDQGTYTLASLYVIKLMIRLPTPWLQYMFEKPKWTRNLCLDSFYDSSLSSWGTYTLSYSFKCISVFPKRSYRSWWMCMMLGMTLNTYNLKSDATRLVLWFSWTKRSSLIGWIFILELNLVDF